MIQRPTLHKTALTQTREIEMKQDKGVLPLEAYVDFFNGKNERPLTVDQLNKIVVMSGFMKLHGFNKLTIRGLLRTVDLTPPSRSTISECLTISSTRAGLSLEEVVKDIASLGWQECPVGSILSIGDEASVDTAPISSSRGTGRAKKNKRKSGQTPTALEAARKIKRKLKKRSLVDLPKLPSPIGCSSAFHL